MWAKKIWDGISYQITELHQWLVYDCGDEKSSSNQKRCCPSILSFMHMSLDAIQFSELRFINNFRARVKKSLFGNLCFLLILSADGNCWIVFILFTLVYSVLVPSQRRNGLIPRLIHALEFKRFVWFDFRSKSNYLLLAVSLILQYSCRFFHFLHLFFW